MRAYLIAILVGLAATGVMLGVSFAITEETPGPVTTTEQAGSSVSPAVAQLAPTLSGGECPAVDRAAPDDAVDLARALVAEAEANPDAQVPSPDESGVDISLGEVPGILADEVAECLLQVDSPGPGWEEILAILRQ